MFIRLFINLAGGQGTVGGLGETDTSATGGRPSHASPVNSLCEWPPRGKAARAGRKAFEGPGWLTLGFGPNRAVSGAVNYPAGARPSKCIININIIMGLV
jgi:hypothetical protein